MMLSIGNELIDVNHIESIGVGETSVNSLFIGTTHYLNMVSGNRINISPSMFESIKSIKKNEDSTKTALAY